MHLGTAIKNARKNKGLTQKQLAEEMGVAEITIRQYEGGKRSPSIEQIKKISTILEVSMDYLMQLPFRFVAEIDDFRDALALSKQIQRRKDNNITGNMRIDLQKGTESVEFRISAFDSDKLKIIFMMIDDGWKVIDGEKYDAEVWEEIPDDTPDE